MHFLEHRTVRSALVCACVIRPGDRHDGRLPELAIASGAATCLCQFCGKVGPPPSIDPLRLNRYLVECPCRPPASRFGESFATSSVGTPFYHRASYHSRADELAASAEGATISTQSSTGRDEIATAPVTFADIKSSASPDSVRSSSPFPRASPSHPTPAWCVHRAPIARRTPPCHHAPCRRDWT